MANKKPDKSAELNPMDELLEFLHSKRDVEHVDYSSPAGRGRLEKRLKKSVSIFLDETDKKFKELSRVYFDCEKRFIKKRADAIIGYIPEAVSRFSDDYPDLCIEAEFGAANSSFGITSYDLLDANEYVTLAAAIWILDELEQRCDIGEVLPLLPADDEIEGVELPEFFEDACHDNSLIKGMMYIIRNRDDDRYNEKERIYKVFINDGSLMRSAQPRDYMKPENGITPKTNREKFDFIMSLLHPVVIDRAAKRFEGKIWEVFDRYLKVVDRYRQEEIRLIDEIYELVEKQKDLLAVLDERDKANYHNPLENKVRSVFLEKYSPQELLRAGGSGIGQSYDDLFAAQSPEEIELERLADVIDEKFRERAEKRAIRECVGMFVGKHDVAASLREISESPEFPDVGSLFGIEVDNPFETCFALLYLIDSGSLLPWLAPLGNAVVFAAAKQLPWHSFPVYDEDDDEFDDDGEDEGEEGTDEESEEEGGSEENDACDEAPSPEGTEEGDSEADEREDEDSDPAPIDWIEEQAKFYKPRYYYAKYIPETKQYEPDKDTLLNFPQFIWCETKVAIPRNIFKFKDMAANYLISGFNESEANLLEKYVTLADFEMIKTLNRERKEHWGETFDDDGDDETEKEAEEPSEQENIDELKKSNRHLKEEIKKIHAEKRSAEREAESLREEIDGLKQELDELRSMIRNPGSLKEESKAVETPAITFPYTAKGRYVVFGGHDSWSKAIRQLLNNVRFIEAGSKPNESLMLHADTVWIQSNAISHKEYYKIIDTVRTHGIAVEYFSFASAEKCAMQLAEYDMEKRE